MYRRPKFLDALLEIRREMAREADNDVASYVEIVQTGKKAPAPKNHDEPTQGPRVQRASEAEPVLEDSKALP